MKSLEVTTPVAEGAPVRGGGARHFVEPKVVVNVQYQGWTDDGNLRHPVFMGLRADVEARDCRAAPPDEVLEAPAEAVEESESAAADAPPMVRSSRRLAITNRDKVFWPDEGYTKGELIDYYAAISDVMLPFLRNRPIVLVRYPDGIFGKNFYQWNVPQGTPDWIRTLRFRDDDGKEGKNTFIVEDGDGLVYIANLGCIPIHILACREQNVEECDFLTIDFDIGPRPFKDAVVLALSLRQLLDDVGLRGFPKTSGQSGLHVLIPMGPGIPFETAKMLVELLGRLLQVRHQDSATMERRVAGRGDRVYIDTGQTGRSRTIVAPYSVRATPGATVSVPLHWDEVHLALDPRQFTMFNVIARAAHEGDPMAGLLDERPNIASVLAKIERKLKS
jgi:bifunctional non-homologous end joining protein LigD